MSMLLQTLERISELGQLGEQLAAECLTRYGFAEVVNVNHVRHNYPFADLLAVRDDVRFLIGVKTRNEMRQERVGINGAYNLVLVNNAKNRLLKSEGNTVDDVTRMALEEVRRLAQAERATPAWVTVSVETATGTFSAYFGLLDHLGNRRSVPMTHEARKRYLPLAENQYDERITHRLLNRPTPNPRPR
jgi:Holliday junction resolvase-like predicted endonuclease